MNRGTSIRVTQDITQANGLVVPTGSTGTVVHTRGGAALVSFTHLHASVMVRQTVLATNTEVA